MKNKAILLAYDDKDRDLMNFYKARYMAKKKLYKLSWARFCLEMARGLK